MPPPYRSRLRAIPGPGGAHAILGLVGWTAEPDAELVAALVARLVSRRGRALLLEGPAGIGTSTLGAAMARRLGADGFHVIPVLAEPALRHIPLGAATAALAGIDAPDDANSAERLQLLAAALAPAAARAVLVVDDAPHLDDASAAAVRQFVRASGVPCVLAARTGETLPEALEHLDAEGLLERMQTPPLADAAAAAAVERALETSVEPESLRTLLRRAAGNPLYLRRLVEEVQLLGMQPSPSGAVIPSFPLPVSLAREIEARFATLSPEQRSLAELLAIAEPLDVALLPAPAALRELERRGLAIRDAGGVRLSHPLFAEYLAETLAGEDGGARRLSAARLLEAAGTDELRFRALGLRLTTPEPPTTAELIWAAEHANSLDDRAVAIRYARHAIASAGASGEAEPSAALVVLADALSMSGRLDEADDAFDRGLAAAGDDTERAHAATRAGFHHAVRRRDPERAAAIGQAVLERLAEPSAHSYLAANIAKWRLMAGRAALEPSNPLGPAEDAAYALNPHLFRLPAAIFAGDVTAARASIDAGRPLVDAARAVTRHGGELLDFGEYLVLVLEARGDDAQAFAERVRPDRFDEAAGMWAYGIALADYHAGRLHDAYRLAETAVEQLEWRDFLGALGAARGLHAAAAAAYGDRAGAERLLAAMRTDAGQFVTADLQAAEAEAWLLHADGDTAAAAARVAEAATAAVEVGYASFAALTASLAVRFGHADAVVPVLRDAARRAPDAPLVARLTAYAEALGGGDPAALLGAAEALASARFLGAAHDAARQAAEAAHARGAASVSRRARALSGRLRGELQWAPARGDATGLSSRELAIARLAADRERNREIADRLGISPRTVENHLANIYRKLGVSGRDELRALLD
jgi:DNA-binding CsgD family transcriptional regulator